ncbi:MAG: 4-alpha-glucanotransferase [Spirochaetaceae bacterium]|nr:4-alpha-glucanotransferase [Spirochaetaceae bacterium]
MSGAAPAPDSSSERPALAALAARLGIAGEYRSALDGSIRTTADATRERLVAAMGFDASSEMRARVVFAALAAEDRDRWLASCRVVSDETLFRTGILLERSTPGRVAFEVEVETESGGFRGWKGWVPTGGASIPLPGPLPWGEHRVRLALRTACSPAKRFEQRLIVTPRTAWPVEAGLPSGRGFGLTAQLYTLRRRDGWGAGDLGALRSLIELASAEGAAFVGLNPLHALANQGDRVGPYSPISRLYGNPVYLELERVPEWAEDEAARRLAGEGCLQAERARLVAGERIDLEAVAAAKQPVLERLYAAFLRREAQAPSERGRAFEAYRAQEGAALEGHARYRTIAEHLSTREVRALDPWDWRTWPIRLRDAGGPAVADLAEANPLRVGFHAWCQFELDRQLGEAATLARTPVSASGSISTSPSAAPGAAATTGSTATTSPPRARARRPTPSRRRAGRQLPPLDPRRLRADGYRLWRRMLRATLRHAGAMRLDHALCLRRLFWIPEGAAAEEGAYVAYPEAEMLGVLALESHRARAAIVAEDLGTVPEGFRDTLHEHGLLTSSVLLFEREGEGFRAAERHPVRAVASAGTHDLPPLAAWLGRDDLRLRRRVGQIPDEASLAALEAEREALQRALASLVATEEARSGPGRPEAGGSEPARPDEPAGEASAVRTPARVAAAVTRFLCRTPAQLVALSVDDLAGETEPINLPGVPPDRHASWCRPIAIAPEALADSPIARAWLDAVPDERRSRPQQASCVSSTRGISTDRTTSGQA